MKTGESPDGSESQWVARALSGEEEAFGALYEAHGRRVKGYFLRSGFALSEAEDLTQDTFLRVFRSLKTFDSQRGRFGWWVATIARNVARKRWSGRKQGEHLDPELAEEMLAGGDNPAATAGSREETEAVRACIELLDKELRVAISLRYVRGLTTRGMAAETGMPEATVRLRLKEAQARIQRCLKRKGILR